MTIVPLNAQSIKQAINLLEKGSLVALPTETVYGLAGDACHGQAIASIFSTKGRPQFNPLIAHVSDIDMAERYVVIDDLSRQLMQKFWPGPLTFVLPLRANHSIHPLTTAGLDSLAVRQPKGGFSDIVKLLGRPLAAPSANKSGRLSPTSAEAVAASLGDKVPLIIDGGASDVGVESTIIKIVSNKAYLLRPGGLASSDIEKALGFALQRVDQRAAIEAPGMMQSHYAPDAFLRLNALSVEKDEALLAFGKSRIEKAERALTILNLSETGNINEAATNLFHYLKQLDLSGALKIAVEPIPFNGLGEAINDRLQRAAAPRNL